MMRPFSLLALSLAALLAVAGCARNAPDIAPPAGMPHPPPRPGSAASVPKGAATADAFDVATPAQREAAAAAPASPAAETALGKTVATLGNPAEIGFWLETPLVSARGPGRVVATETGKAAQLELRPIDGPAGAGSRISLSALKLLGLPLAGLHELTVYAQ